MSPLFLVVPFILTSSDTSAQTIMESFLPSSIREWNVSEAPRFYAGRAIFDYMDGAGEIYLAYDFQNLLVRRYACPGQEEILVEIFDMRLSRNAFGIFTYMKGRGPAVQIGQEGEYKSGLLCFWKGKYFVCVRIENENEPAKNALLELGRVLSDAIRDKGELPAILNFLPEGEFIPGSLRYFFRTEILNIHFYLSDRNILHLNGTTEGVLVRLKRDKSYLLLVGYPDPGQADSAYENFLAQYMPDAERSGSVRTENKKWTSCMKRGSYVVVVFDAPKKSDALMSLETVGRRLP